MNKSARAVAIFTLVTVLFVESAPSAFAFQAVLLPNQTLKVTHGEVLGKNDESSGGSESSGGGSESSSGKAPEKTMSPEEYKKFEADYIKANNISPEQIRARDERVAEEARKAAEKKNAATGVRSTSSKTGVNPVLPSLTVANKKLRLSVQDNKGRLEVIDKNRDSSPSSKLRELKKPENETETEHPAQRFDDSFVKLQLVNGGDRPFASSAAGLPQPRREDNKRPEENQRPEDNQVSIQTPASQDNPTQLEIESRRTRSRVQPGSNVIVDPRTNDITISDQNGKDQPLKRLPDQAFQDLTLQGAVFPENYDEAKANLTIETKDDGSVVYHTEVTDQRKLFGFIPYKVKVAHEVNDTTGEVSTQLVPDTSFFGRFRKLFGQ